MRWMGQENNKWLNILCFFFSKCFFLVRVKVNSNIFSFPLKQQKNSWSELNRYWLKTIPYQMEETKKKNFKSPSRRKKTKHHSFPKVTKTVRRKTSFIDHVNVMWPKNTVEKKERTDKSHQSTQNFVHIMKNGQCDRTMAECSIWEIVITFDVWGTNVCAFIWLIYAARIRFSYSLVRSYQKAIINYCQN